MSHLRITAANELTVDLDDGRRFPVHPLWLRERCQDAQTFNLRTGQRLGDPSDLDLRLALLSVSEPEPGRIRVRFSDGHESDFLAADILAEAALAPGEHDIPAPRLWDSTLPLVPRATWSAQPGDAALMEWVSAFLE